MSTVICKCCECTITDANFKVYAYQEEFPDINLGPYCKTCWDIVKVCSGCQHDFIVDRNIKYFNNGVWLCEACEENVETCSSCSSIVPCDHQDADGNKICATCFATKYFMCGVCDKLHSKENDDVFRDPTLRLAKAGMYKKYGSLCTTCFEENKARFKTYEVKFCKRCGDDYTKSSVEGYCPSCGYKTFTCTSCSSIHHDKHRIDHVGTDGVMRNVTICGNCESTKYKYCTSCEAYHLKSDFVRKRVNGKMKLTCFLADKSCDICHKAVRTTFGINGKDYCKKCKDKVNICNKCGGVFFKHQSSNGDVCSKCIAENGSYNINSYSYKPTPIFHSTNEKGEDNIYFGIENELRCNQSKVNDIIKLEGDEHFYAKNDSSISGDGFEIVTHPHTLLSHKQIKCPLFDGAERHKSCGMHVHVAKDNFTTFHLFKFLSFFNKQRVFVEGIAERSGSTYSQDLSNDQCKKTSKDKRNSERYQAVNLQCDHTVEVRIFASATTDEIYHKNIEFVHALLTFTRTASKKDATSSSIFSAFVEDNKKIYPNLDAFIKNM